MQTNHGFALAGLMDYRLAVHYLRSPLIVLLSFVRSDSTPVSYAIGEYQVKGTIAYIIDRRIVGGLYSIMNCILIPISLWFGWIPVKQKKLRSAMGFEPTSTRGRWAIGQSVWARRSATLLQVLKNLTAVLCRALVRAVPLF